ncbi:hypothetical protein MOD25_05730 [Bacillus haynesii]|uniref:hypothetical protein n=1 Tax=Bacillus haynesii TaxID=1925021 RepID=UPI002280B4FA|nr:hypothetical protein [Bacillus haynesii]MCY8549402.1 hypothetical protein [Bacillus haynesii]
MEIFILEGCRGTGKTSVAIKLRQRTPETTLINFTGFHDDGESGLNKVKHYYDSWMNALFSLSSHQSKFVFDRFYFSEMVYSHLYKEYSFKHNYENLNNLLEDLSEMGVKIHIILLTINDETELLSRLIRDKVPFSKVDDSVQESLKQQEIYKKLFDQFYFKYGSENLLLHEIDTSGKESDEVFNLIIENLNEGR